MILVVGSPGGWEPLKRALPEGTELRFVAAGELTPRLVRDLRPDLVVARLVDPRLDALEVARILVAAGFRGRLRAVTAPLPSPALVRREIEEAAADIDVDLVVVTRRAN